MLTHRGLPLEWGAGWVVTREQGVGQLFRAEGPEDTYWTVTVVGADLVFLTAGAVRISTLTFYM